MDDNVIERLTKDLKSASRLLSNQEARYLVDSYYQVQDYRKAANNQVRALLDTQEPCSVLAWYFRQMQTLENQIRNALDAWSDSQAIGVWAKSICGIGPVISAGLMAHIDITKAPTVGHIWHYAGLDPTTTWEKKTKRPWNASLKVLCWKIGESFVKVSGNANDIYGQVYLERKQLEQINNAGGLYAEQAARVLASKNIGKETDAYKAYSQGFLPPAHIHARAKRYAVKLFLSHYHNEDYRLHYGVEPPKPYPIDILGHAHYIAPPELVTA